MALRDWDIVGDVALREVNGQEIIVRKGVHASLPAAIAVWEAREQQMLQARLIELGSIVDGAMNRLRARHTGKAGAVVRLENDVPSPRK